MRSAAASHHINDAYVADLKEAYGVVDAPAPTSALYAAPVARLMPEFASGIASMRRATATAPAKVSKQWWKGPIDPAGTLVDLSDRPIMCMATNAGASQAALGCSDHASYVLDFIRCQKQKTLFGKRVGHSEWVTSVAYVRDGSNRVVSAGMDGKIIIWDAVTSKTSLTADPRCNVLEGHFGSISSVAAPKGEGEDGICAFGHLISSCGYDKSVRLWDSRTGRSMVELREHSAPALIQSIQPQTAETSKLLSATGDRDGVVKVWDYGAGASIGTLGGHKGHITSLTWLSPITTSATGESAPTVPSHDGLIASGAQDGHVRFWDIRAKRCVANIELHVTDAGAGAVGDIIPAVLNTGASSDTGGTETVIVTAGADKAVCVLDPRAGFAPRHRLTTHKDFIYSLAVQGSIALSGDGSGMLIAHDLVEGKPLWGLGANAAAVRCIGIVGSRMLVAGDDGKALFYDFA